MKILIAADMEGITGVTTWDQVTPVISNTRASAVS
jgi:D-aminopeptidase